MTHTEVMFGFKGRIGRLAYFGYNIACLMTFRAQRREGTAGRGGSPLGSGEGRIGSTLTV